MDRLDSANRRSKRRTRATPAHCKAARSARSKSQTTVRLPQIAAVLLSRHSQACDQALQYQPRYQDIFRYCFPVTRKSRYILGNSLHGKTVYRRSADDVQLALRNTRIRVRIQQTELLGHALGQTVPGILMHRLTTLSATQIVISLKHCHLNATQ